MFTSLRARLWLSYAFVITIALMIVATVLLAFLIRNPFATREIQQRLRDAQNSIVASPQSYIDNPNSLQQITQTYNVRTVVFNSARQLVFDSNSNMPPLPFPRRNLLGRNIQNEKDSNNQIWIYMWRRLSPDRVIVIAAPRPRVPVLNIFKDQLLLPILQGGLIALLLSLILAFALSRWVADPLQQLIVAARNYPSDNMRPVLPRGPHEVQDLAKAFNSMVERVESSQKSQRDFVADVSHELKTPLTSIQGFAQAILDDTASTPDARRQAAQIIYDEAGRMHRMALDLLDLARLEAGTADLKMSPVDLSALLRNIVEKFKRESEQVGVALQLDLPENLPPLIGDGDRLAQVFINLVDNALKFTPANGRITLNAGHVGTQMEISIADTGVGVPKEALFHLFDRFYQVDPSRAGGEKHGAGLGLAIVQEIVQAHGGKIDVRSEVGRGTTFVIHLPLAT